MLAQSLDASPSQVSLLCTSYFAVTGVSMLVSGVAAAKLGVPVVAVPAQFGFDRHPGPAGIP